MSKMEVIIGTRFEGMTEMDIAMCYINVVLASVEKFCVPYKEIECVQTLHEQLESAYEILTELRKRNQKVLVE